MEKEEIGKKIKILRKTRGLTQQQLAEKLNPPLKRATISNYEIGRRSPRNIKELEGIAEALGVNLEYFGFGGSEVYDLVGRAKMLFENEEITAEEKAKAYKEIMKLYLKVED
jgi:transcriptional regulator with XRE-family HTH domain